MIDYPCTFKTSDGASLIAQKNYIRFSVFNFLLLIIAAFCSSSVFHTRYVLYKPFAWIVIVSLFLALITKLTMKIWGWDKKWFDTRSVAESIKTATWRYAMGVKPFGLDLSSQEVDKVFTEKIKSIITSMPDIERVISTCLASGKEITDQMREIRAKNVNEKKNIYLKERVQDQRNWYGKKAKYNGRREFFWFIAIIVTESTAIIFAFCMLNAQCNIFNPIALITTIAGVFVAWTEMKRFRELSQSYALAAQELASAESLISSVTDATTLTTYVDDTENAISREHTMWRAKRS
jgi:hypothetical protein